MLKVKLLVQRTILIPKTSDMEHIQFLMMVILGIILTVVLIRITMDGALFKGILLQWLMTQRQKLLNTKNNLLINNMNFCANLSRENKWIFVLLSTLMINAYLSCNDHPYQIQFLMKNQELSEKINFKFYNLINRNKLKVDFNFLNFYVYMFFFIK